jgi:arsenate reductase
VNVLFVCEDNCALSIIAESILRAVAPDRFGAYSAGCSSREGLDPDVLGFLADRRLPVEGLHAKTLRAFQGPSAPRMDFIITLSDGAAKQDFSDWPGRPFVAHWNVCGDDGEAMDVELRDYFWTLMRRIKIFASLPHGKLSRRVLEQRALTLQPSHL